MSETIIETKQLSKEFIRDQFHVVALKDVSLQVQKGEFVAFNLIPVLTALENVELPLKLTNLKKAERIEHATTALKLVGLGDRLHHLPRQLSGGQEQRVAMARAIVTDPALILADEPTGNLDAASAEEVLNILARLNKEFGKTIVMVTHDPHAAQHATDVHHLEKGQLTA